MFWRNLLFKTGKVQSNVDYEIVETVLAAL